jgi:hypothetical protein
MSAGYSYAKALLKHPPFSEVTPMPNLYLQFYNEQGYQPYDGWFNIGMAEACAEVGHKVIMFNDANGNPSGPDWLKKWQARIPAMQYAYAKNLPIGQHIYGSPDHPDESLSHADNVYFANRFNEFYSIMPTNAQPDLFITECGTNSANRPSDKSVQDDILQLIKVWRRYPYVKGFAYWTIQAGGTNWQRGDYSDELPQIFQHI